MVSDTPVPVALTLHVNMDAAAFEVDRGFELARVLELVVEAVADGEVEGLCLDSNGNTCGAWAVDL